MVFGLPGYTYVDIVDLGGLEYSTWIRGISGNYSRVKQKVLQNGVMSQVHPIPNTSVSSPSLRISPTKMPQKGKLDHLNQLEIISFRDQLEINWKSSQNWFSGTIPGNPSVSGIFRDSRGWGRWWWMFDGCFREVGFPPFLWKHPEKNVKSTNPWWRFCCLNKLPSVLQIVCSPRIGVFTLENNPTVDGMTLKRWFPGGEKKHLWVWKMNRKSLLFGCFQK